MPLEVIPICPFGNVLWWNLLLNGYSVDLSENFQKQTWRNRYDILGANGIQNLTIPITRESGKKTKTSEIRLFNADDWKRIHWRSIKSAYGSSPFWIHYSDELEHLFSKDYQSLKEFFLASVNYITEELEIDMELKYNSLNNEIVREPHNFKPAKCSVKYEPYIQVFSDRFSFSSNLSILDVLFNLGPESEAYIRKCGTK